MNHLPWSINPKNPRVIIDNAGCPVLDLNVWGVIGPEHDGEEIIKFIVEKLNGGPNEMERRLQREPRRKSDA